MGLVVGSFARCHQEGQGPKVILSGGSIRRLVVGVEIKRLGLLGTSQIVVPCHFPLHEQRFSAEDICGCHSGGALRIECVGARDAAQHPTVPGMSPPPENDPTSMSAVLGGGRGVPGLESRL